MGKLANKALVEGALPTPEQVVPYVLDRLLVGRSRIEIVADLCSWGFSEEMAWDIVEHTTHYIRSFPKRRAVKKMLLWGGIASGAAAVSLWGYWSASLNPEGGTYCVFGGAIVIGGWNLFKALVEYIKCCRE